MQRASKMVCPECGVEMNYHADKIVYGEGGAEESGGRLVEAHACPSCGRGATREADEPAPVE
jgi:predicted RNA-binding Zn-ribbon protein involved in translation (DUF1610 family)